MATSRSEEIFDRRGAAVSAAEAKIKRAIVGNDSTISYARVQVFHCSARIASDSIGIEIVNGHFEKAAECRGLFCSGENTEG